LKTNFAYLHSSKTKYNLETLTLHADCQEIKMLFPNVTSS